MLGRVLPFQVHSINRTARSRFKRRAAVFSAAAFYFDSTRTIAPTCHSERSVPMYLFPEIVPYDFRSGRAVEARILPPMLFGESLFAFIALPEGTASFRLNARYFDSTSDRSPSSPLAAESPKLPASWARCPAARRPV